MLAYDIAIMTVNVLSALIKSYNQNKISYKMIKEHTNLKLSFLKDVRNEIKDVDLLKMIDNIIQEVEILLKDSSEGNCICRHDIYN